MFGKLSIDPLSETTEDAVLMEGLPDDLAPAKAGLTITLVTGLGPDRMHLDEVEVEIPDRGLCKELDKRLAKLWGRRSPWVNSARHLTAKLDWAGSEAGTAACTLRIERIPTSDAGRCLSDEEPNATWEIDVGRRCLKPARPHGCMLARDTQVHQKQCSVDDRRHTFWRTSGPSDHRACTGEELKLVDFDALRECGQPSAVPAPRDTSNTQRRMIEWRVYKNGDGCMAARMVECPPSTTASIGRRHPNSVCKVPPPVPYACPAGVAAGTAITISGDGTTCFVENADRRDVPCPKT